MTTVARPWLPAQSSATIVIVLSPSWRGNDPTDQRALVADPLRVAKPCPPRSLIQPSLYRRRLSVAAPLNEAVVLANELVAGSMVTFGAMGSSDRQRRRSACSRSESLPPCPVSVATAASSFAPPHPEIATQAMA